MPPQVRIGNRLEMPVQVQSTSTNGRRWNPELEIWEGLMDAELRARYLNRLAYSRKRTIFVLGAGAALSSFIAVGDTATLNTRIVAGIVGGIAAACSTVLSLLSRFGSDEEWTKLSGAWSARATVWENLWTDYKSGKAITAAAIKETRLEEQSLEASDSTYPQKRRLIQRIQNELKRAYGT